MGLQAGKKIKTNGNCSRPLKVVTMYLPTNRSVDLHTMGNTCCCEFTYSGLWLFEVTTYHYKRPVYDDAQTKAFIEEDFINHIATLRNGNHIISGRDAMYLLNGKTYHIRKLDSLPSDRGATNFALQDKNGLIWVGTSKGIFCMDSTLHMLGKARGVSMIIL